MHNNAKVHNTNTLNAASRIFVSLVALAAAGIESSEDIINNANADINATPVPTKCDLKYLSAPNQVNEMGNMNLFVKKLQDSFLSSAHSTLPIVSITFLIIGSVPALIISLDSSDISTATTKHEVIIERVRGRRGR
jgi:hypothetical protein